MRDVKWLVIFFCVNSSPATAAETDYRSRLCDNGVIAKQICESRSLSFGAPPAGTVLKNDGLLTIKAKNGTSMKLGTCSETHPDDKCDRYSVVFEMTHQYIWLVGSHYESGSITLISHESGRKYAFQEDSESGQFLSISPDGQCLLVDDEGDNRSIFKLFRFTNAELQLVKKYESVKASSPLDAFWKDCKNSLIK